MAVLGLPYTAAQGVHCTTLGDAVHLHLCFSDMLVVLLQCWFHSVSHGSWCCRSTDYMSSEHPGNSVDDNQQSWMAGRPRAELGLQWDSTLLATAACYRDWSISWCSHCWCTLLWTFLINKHCPKIQGRFEILCYHNLKSKERSRIYSTSVHGWQD